MEFRRVEIKKTVRHAERVTETADAKEIFSSILRNCLPFSARVSKVGFLKECRVVEVGDNEVKIVSKTPAKLTVSASFSDVESIEVESNYDFVAEEKDGGGRWARMIL